MALEAKAAEATTPAPTANAGRTVAVTGACTYLGQELLKRLEEDRHVEGVLALDVRSPDLPLEKTTFRHIDLTMPTAGADLADALAEAGASHVVHAAFLSNPTHQESFAHELEDIGTMHVIDACARTQPARLVMVSTTMVYGSSAKNPNYLTEDHPLTGRSLVADRVRAEAQVDRFAENNPDVAVATLRLAPILGPTISNLVTRFFSRPLAPVLMGYDPLVQLVHETDAATALALAERSTARGAFNIVGPGVLPYTTVLAFMGKVPIPVPGAIAGPLARALWATQIANVPAAYLDLLRYMCVADGARAGTQLGFAPRFTLKRTILDFLGVADDGAPDLVGLT